MNILLLQTKGVHPQNRQYREALCMKRALDRIPGITPVVWGKNYKNFKVPFIKLSNWADVIFVLENYSKKAWVPNLSKNKNLTIFWSIDSHMALNRHLNIANSHKINIVLNSTSAFINNFKTAGRKVYWFPNCYPADLIKPLPEVRQKFNVGFCGRELNRAPYLKELSNRFTIKKDIFVLGDAMVKAINSYKIHFNKNIKNDINYRTFETLGCKTFLITNETDRLKDLFIVGKHLVTYNSLQSCIEKIGWYLRNQKERLQIETEGYKHALKNHTYDNRAKQLVKIIKENI
jgi:spore maturation protein CgeB